ncbi:AMP-binding protein [Myxococcota bacterium]
MTPRYPTVVDALLAHADRAPDRLFVSFGSEPTLETWTFGETVEKARMAAGALVGHNLRPGDRLVIVGRNTPTTGALLLGAMGCGVIPAVVHPPLRADARAAQRLLQRVITKAEPALVVARRELWPAPTGVKLATAEELLGAGAPAADLVPPDPDSVVYLQFSSGTTGAQKAVAISANAQAANAEATYTHVGEREEETWVIWLPLFHDMGLMTGYLVPLFFGHRTILMRPERFVERPMSWMQTIHAHRGTMTCAPNFAYGLAARRARPDRIRDLDLSCLRVAYNGAEMVSADTVERFESAFAPTGLAPNTVLPVYGLAELTLSAVFWHAGEPKLVDRVTRAGLGRGVAEPASPDDRRAMRVVSVGRALRGHRARVVDETGMDAKDRQVGELWVAGASRAAGYWRDPALTAEVFTGGWVRTGDLAYSANGELFICGRSKDVVVRFGENFFPADLEMAVTDGPGVKPGRLAVLGVEDTGMATERVWLVVETDLEAEDAYGLARDIRRHVVEKAGFKFDGVSCVPRGFIEKTSSGKVKRFNCRDKLATMFRSGSPPPTVGRWPDAVSEER